VLGTAATAPVNSDKLVEHAQAPPKQPRGAQQTEKKTDPSHETEKRLAPACFLNIVAMTRADETLDSLRILAALVCRFLA
jgi:hypothetical protein